jgi:magnesium chelatase subunit D
VQDVREPQDVSAILDSDAGKVFYHRETPGEVLHIDTFHSPGQVDPRGVARLLVSALSGMQFEASEGRFSPSMETFLSYIDVQTAVGGGRIDGQLSYGQEQGVRAAHQTHVHVTALFAPEVVSSIFTIVAAVESAIEEAGLELRRVARVRTVRGSAPMDMSAYQASSDSLLKQTPQGQGESGQSSLFRQEALARQVAREVGSAEDARRLLEQLSKGLKSGEFARQRFGAEKSPEEVRQALSRSRLMRFDGQKYSLTEDGAQALSFITEHAFEIEAYLRRVIWSLPRRNIPQG